MRKLSIKEKTAVFISLAVVAFFFAFIGLFGFQLGGGTSQSGTVVDSVNTAQPDSDSSSLFVSDVVVGSGAEARPGQIITVHYTGTLTDGRVFDSSLNRGQPFSFVLGAGQVIKGWDRGVVGMKVGGTRVLTIPPELAYGANAIGGIPSNSTLIFNVELLSVENLQ